MFSPDVYDRTLIIAMQVMRLREEVKSLAEDAQGDIGLDYAWLDDVTYADWQRYHDLERSKLLQFLWVLREIPNNMW